MVALGLTLIRRFRLATGAFTLVLGLLVTTVSPTFGFLPAIIAASVVVDGLYYGVRDRWSPVGTVRLLSAALPIALLAFYFATVALVSGLGWSIHVWTGGIVSAGLVGLLVSYVVVPSRRFVTIGVEALAEET